MRTDSIDSYLMTLQQCTGELRHRTAPPGCWRKPSWRRFQETLLNCQVVIILEGQLLKFFFFFHKVTESFRFVFVEMLQIDLKEFGTFFCFFFRSPPWQRSLKFCADPPNGNLAVIVAALSCFHSPFFPSFPFKLRFLSPLCA